MKKLNLSLLVIALILALLSVPGQAQSLDDAINRLWSKGPDAGIEKTLQDAAASSDKETANRAFFHLSCLKILSGAADADEILAALDANAVTEEEKQLIATLRDRLNTSKNALPESFKEKISLDFKDINLRQVIPLIAKQANANIVLHASVNKKVTIRLIDATLEQALDTICAITDLHYENRNGVFVLLPEKAEERNYFRTYYRLTSMSPSRAIKLLKEHVSGESDGNQPANFPDSSGHTVAGLPSGVSLSSDGDRVILEGERQAVEKYLELMRSLDLKDRAHKLSFRIWQLNKDSRHDIKTFAELPEKARGECAKIIAAPAIITLPGQLATIEVEGLDEDGQTAANSLDYKVECIFTETGEPQKPLKIVSDIYVFGTSVVNGEKLQTNKKFSHQLLIKPKNWVMLPLYGEKEKFFLELMIEKK